MFRGRAAQRRPRIQFVPRKQTQIRPRRNARTPDFFSAVLNALGVALRHPLFVLTVLLAVAFVLTFESVDKGPISVLLPSNSTNVFVTWARGNIAKFAGLIIFIPVIVDAPRNQAAPLAVVVVVWVLLVPEGAYVEYAIQAVALHLFFHLRINSHRLAVIAIVVICYFAGFILSGKKSK